jgi:hypothetical protein
LLNVFQNGFSSLRKVALTKEVEPDVFGEAGLHRKGSVSFSPKGLIGGPAVIMGIGLFWANPGSILFVKAFHVIF